MKGGLRKDLSSNPCLEKKFQKLKTDSTKHKSEFFSFSFRCSLGSLREGRLTSKLEVERAQPRTWKLGPKSWAHTTQATSLCSAELFSCSEESSIKKINCKTDQVWRFFDTNDLMHYNQFFQSNAWLNQGSKIKRMKVQAMPELGLQFSGSAQAQRAEAFFEP